MQTINKVVENHVMLDIETLSVDPNAFITSVAMVVFNPYAPECINPECYNESLDPWVEQKGSHIDTNTVVWRQRQDERTKTPLRKAMVEYQSLKNMLLDLEAFMKKHDVKKVWANSPSFDCTIINNAAKRELGREIIPFYKECDVRTAKYFVEQVSGSKVDLGNNHTPYDDCINQINLVQLAHHYMEQINESGTTESRPS